MSSTILPRALDTALDGRNDIALLSLDCFDTLLWRDTHAPADIFTLLPGIAPAQRIRAEQHARRRALVQTRRNEVTIEQIYAALLPNADASVRDEAVRAEIDAEARHCFAFAPTVALMRAARARNIPVVIVSDTYFSAGQLLGLIRRAAGDDVAALIDAVFTSSERGMSKGEGLFGPMLRARRVAPETVLHIGDNKAADLEAATRHRIQALHLRQFDEATVQRLRLEATAGTLLDAGGTAYQPHRAAIAIAAGADRDLAGALGYSVLGPVLLPFARWIASESAALETGSGRVHRLFLMRDGHLPRRVFDAAFPEAGSHAIEISRYTAIAAGLVDADAVRAHVESELGNDDTDTFLGQLLWTPEEIAKLPAAARDGFALGTLAKAALAPPAIARTLRRSRAFAERMVAYLQREIAPVAGDTLMLVDLGYNGTVQNHLAERLSAMLDVAVAGRYLLLRENDMPGRDKRGFLDRTHYDDHALEALAANVAVLEQLCTAAQGSVIDYDAQGAPVRRGNSIKARQSDTREAAQAGCVAYARVGDAAIIRANTADRDAAERRGAAGALARLMFLPQPEELAVLSRFEHDVNLGGDDVVSLFDADVAARGLKERGLFYLKGAERMYLPAELRGHGLPLNLTLLTQRRFGLDLRYADFCDGGIDVPILLADGHDVLETSVRAVPTHDGYFLAAIPIGAGRFSVGMQFGRNYEWLQILSARFMPVKGYLGDKPVAGDRIIDAVPSLEGMEQTAPHLFRCSDASAFLMAAPAAGTTAEPMLLTVAFRPIVAREAADASADPAPTDIPAGVRR